MHTTPHRVAAPAFTLIELLIVVAIISILASIAVPNFLEAQTRARVSRVLADMTTMRLAIESYQIDNREYPKRRNSMATDTRRPHVPLYADRAQQLAAMTTPIAYLNALPVDIFDYIIEPPNNLIDYYDLYQTTWLINYRWSFRPERQVDIGGAGWTLVSVGPDGWLGAYDASTGEPLTPFELRGTVYIPYDPTNGTISSGNIYGSQAGMGDVAGRKLIERIN